MVVEKRQVQWEYTIHGGEGPARKMEMSVNSIDGDMASARVTVEGRSVIVPIADLYEIFGKLEPFLKAKK